MDVMRLLETIAATIAIPIGYVASSVFERRKAAALTREFEAVVKAVQDVLHATWAEGTSVIVWPITRTKGRKAAAQKPAQPLARPPKTARLLVRLTVRAGDQEALLGDMEEMYHNALRDHGRTWAAICYYAQAVRSLLPLLWTSLKSAGVITAALKLIHKIAAK